MKTITYYGLSIYIFLTAIHGISAIESPPLSKDSAKVKKCNLSEVIKASDHVEKCRTYSPIDTGDLPPVDLGNVVQYLCTGIYETANRICELNINHPSTNPTALRNQIDKLQPVANNLTNFCLTMTHVISNSTYNSAINSNTDPTIIHLNKFLVEGCKDVCWKTIPKTTASSLCSVLLWENEIIANSTITMPLRPIATNPQSPLLTAAKKPAGNHQPQQSQSGQQVVGNSAIHETETENQAAKLSGNGENSDKLKVTAKPTLPVNKINENPHEKDDNPNSQEYSKVLGKDTEVEIGTGNLAQKTQVTQVRNEQIHADNSQVQTGERTDTRVDDSLLKKKPIGNEEIAQGADQKPDIENDDNVGKLPEDEEDEDPVLDHADLSRITDKRIDTDQSNQIPASSNHDKEDESDGQKKADTDQESTAPREHRLLNSGPLDPPQHFFAYFMAVSFICLLCYVGYHKKHKIMAIIFEGRKSRGGRGRRRPNTAGYRKLDCNLEEAVTSQCNSNVTHVIY